MATVKRPDKNRPSRIRYHAEHHRERNKMRRILKCNGQAFLEKWMKNHG